MGALRHTRLRIQINRTIVNERLNGLMVSVYYHKRAIPLLWSVLLHKGNSTFHEHNAILPHLAQLLPSGCVVVIWADREFGQADMMRSIRLHNWDFCLRGKGTHFIRPTHGTHYFLTDVVLTQAQCYGTAHFALACEIGSTVPWFIATNLPPSRRTLRDYARRFGCEEMFSDLKARGFHLDLS